MYHVSNDVRAKKSAALICQGLGKCLEEKPLSSIRIMDIYEKCYVSRATFYRLFDDIRDIFIYECDNIFADILKMIENNKFQNKGEEAIFCIKRWLEHDTLMKALAENNLIGIIYDTHIRNSELLKRFYSIRFEDEKKVDYFIAILASLTYASLTVYYNHGATEPIEQVYDTVRKCTRILADNFC